MLSAATGEPGGNARSYEEEQIGSLKVQKAPAAASPHAQDAHDLPLPHERTFGIDITNTMAVGEDNEHLGDRVAVASSADGSAIAHSSVAERCPCARSDCASYGVRLVTVKPSITCSPPLAVREATEALESLLEARVRQEDLAGVNAALEDLEDLVATCEWLDENEEDEEEEDNNEEEEEEEKDGVAHGLEGNSDDESENTETPSALTAGRVAHAPLRRRPRFPTATYSAIPANEFGVRRALRSGTANRTARKAFKLHPRGPLFTPDVYLDVRATEMGVRRN
ncbi:hypothetical protein BD626DRAFT_575348 [Schizophyllum amplum]|uniref:Uncharacterized protein n=1 Tax=Schizophyllum amplum TaxID=97359 RepID=A0A550BW10_9AGAR|nr:hypothetical protein BD626DRAFT_575348 [Auriculariopsis ampla]